MDRFKYIHFVQVEDKGRTMVWECRNNSSGDVLAVVKWYRPWRQYCLFTAPGVVFNCDCLLDVCEFMRRVQGEHAESMGKRTPKGSGNG